MCPNKSVITYLTTMREYKNQMKRMGDIIADSTHAATILRNVPKSWRHVAQTIRMITRIPDKIEESLEETSMPWRSQIKLQPHSSRKQNQTDRYITAIKATIRATHITTRPHRRLHPELHSHAITVEKPATLLPDATP